MDQCNLSPCRRGLISRALQASRTAGVSAYQEVFRCSISPDSVSPGDEVTVDYAVSTGGSNSQADVRVVVTDSRNVAVIDEVIDTVSIPNSTIRNEVTPSATFQAPDSPGDYDVQVQLVNLQTF